MTLHATRDGEKITIGGNTGLRVSMRDDRVTDVSITDHFMHVRHFWGSLGRLLDEAEQEAQVHEPQQGGF